MNVYPIVTTPSLAECRQFYVKAFNADVLFESEWYVHLRISGWEVGFLRPNPPKKLPVFQHAMLSRGLCFAVEVEDVQSVYRDLTTRGFDALGKPEAFPSGEVAFSVVDPAGVVLNIVERRGPGSAEVVQL